MGWNTTVVRKAVDDEPETAKVPVRGHEAERETTIRESRNLYRGFVDSINRASDKDIERALSRAS